MLGGEAIPLKQILELMAAIRGRRARRLEVAGRVAEIGAAVLEFIADHVTRRSHSDKAEGVRITLRAKAIEQKGAGRCAHFSTAECCAVLVGHLAGGNRTPIRRLQQHRPQQLLRRDQRPPNRRIERRKLAL